jgi:hypothetical protein
MAGVCLGLSQYFYEGGRLLYPMVFLAWGSALLIVYRSQQLLKGLLITLAVGVFVGMPIYYTLIGNELPLTTRMDITSIEGQGWETTVLDMLFNSERRDTFNRQASVALLHFFKYTDQSLFYGGDTALLLAVIMPFFFLGGAILINKPFHPASLLLIAWIAATIIGNGLVRDSDHSTRFVVVFPALVILASLGIRYILPMPFKLIPKHWVSRLPNLFVSSLLIVLTIVIAGEQIRYYWTVHLPNFNVQIRDFGTPDFNDAIYRSLDFPEGTQIHFISERLVDGSQINGIAGYLAPDRYLFVTHRIEDITTEYLETLPRDVDYAFYVERGYEESVLALINQYFVTDEAQMTPFAEVPENKDFLLYYANSGS